MELPVDGLQTGGVHMGVDLRRRDVGVAEHFLNDAQVGPAGEQMGGEAMPEKVGVDVGFEPGTRCVAFDELPNALRRQFFPRTERKISAPVRLETSFGRSISR